MGIIEQGTCGTCVWELDGKKTLTIRPQDGKSGVLRSDHGWPLRNVRKIVIKDGVKADVYAGKMFAGMEDCAMFDVEKLDVSATENMHGMFECCSSMENVAGLEKWDVSNLTVMSYMFHGCSSLKDISALAGWNVSRVTDMKYAFHWCESLTDISSLKKWDISNVINTCCMFRGCTSLKDISHLFGWNVPGIRRKDRMFSYTDISCDVLDTLIPIACPREGAFIGYKKCCSGRIVQLEIPEGAKRSSAYGKKCRCSKAKVLNIWAPDGEEAEHAVSIYDDSFVYRKGETVKVSCFDRNRFKECASGIHLFMTREEAEDFKAEDSTGSA